MLKSMPGTTFCVQKATCSVSAKKLSTRRSRTIRPTGRIVAHGGTGNDDVQVAGGITLPAWLYGDDGNDRLKGGSGPNVILGGPGDDLLVGGSNRDLLIGGTSADKIVGNEADDILQFRRYTVPKEDKTKKTRDETGIGGEGPVPARGRRPTD